MTNKSVSESSIRFSEGGKAILPFTGKYAVKDENMFQKIRNDNVLANELTYYPLRVEVELTTECNDTCSHCGMGAVKIGTGLKLSTKHIDHIVNELSICKIPSVAITGGEPLLYADNFFYFMEQCILKGIEISKITTNGFWGTNKLAEVYLDKMYNLGLASSKYFIPLISLSLGEQTTSYESLSRIIYIATNKFSEKELNIGIWSMSEFGKDPKTISLIEEYEKIYGDFPYEKLHLTHRTYVFSPRIEFETDMSSQTVSIYDIINNSYGCFTFTAGSNLLPTGLIKSNGDFFTCSGFDVPNRLNFGNVYSSSLLDILHKIDKDPHIKLVKDKGLENYKQFVDDEVLKNTFVRSYCEACNYLTNLVKL